MVLFSVILLRSDFFVWSAHMCVSICISFQILLFTSLPPLPTIPDSRSLSLSPAPPPPQVPLIQLESCCQSPNTQAQQRVRAPVLAWLSCHRVGDWTAGTKLNQSTMERVWLALLLMPCCFDLCSPLPQERKDNSGIEPIGQVSGSFQVRLNSLQREATMRKTQWCFELKQTKTKQKINITLLISYYLIRNGYLFIFSKSKNQKNE